MIQLEVISFCDSRIRCFRPRWQRTLYCVAGPVSRNSRVVLLYTGKRRKALREAERLKRYGYQVQIRRLRKTAEKMGGQAEDEPCTVGTAAA